VSWAWGAPRLPTAALEHLADHDGRRADVDPVGRARDEAAANLPTPVMFEAPAVATPGVQGRDGVSRWVSRT